MPKRVDGRERCYEEIVVSCKEGFARFYAEFPERIGDERAGDALAWSLRGIQRIHRILDQYDIAERPPKAEGPS